MLDISFHGPTFQFLLPLQHKAPVAVRDRVSRLNKNQPTTAHSLIVSRSFHGEPRSEELKSSVTLGVKSGGRTGGVRFIAVCALCDCGINEERRDEGYLADQPCSPVAARSVIVNTYLHHVIQWGEPHYSPCHKRNLIRVRW